MYAIVQDGGKQYWVKEGDLLEVELRDATPGTEVAFEKVLLVSHAESQAEVGTPYVAGARVVACVKEHGRGKKLIAFKFRKRKNSRRKIGHRQDFTRVEIRKIEYGAAS